MSTTLYTAFLSEVMPFVHDCPQIAAVNAIRNAAIELCEKSHIWQIDSITPITVTSGVTDYTISVPIGTKLVAINEAWFGGVLLVPKSPEELTRIYRWTDWRTFPGNPTYITQVSTTDVLLVPVPQVTNTSSLTMRAVIAPQRSSTGIDTELYERYLETIAAGARARLYGTPGAPYYDPNLSVEQNRSFMHGINEAKIKANKGNTRASVAVEFQPFGR